MTQNTNTPKQYSDGNTTGDVAFCGTDSAGNPGKGGFFGITTPVVQPNAPIDTDNESSTISIYQISFSPSSVGATTTAEQTTTVTGITTSDLVVVNKPAAQTGLGIVGYRASAADAIGVTFANVSSGAITPSASEVYTVMAVKGNAVKTATLSPAAVAAYTTAEQTFTVTGARLGQLAVVNKPTAQTGLGIANVRVTAKDTVGITFVNDTAAAITPTASESYSFAFMNSAPAVGGVLQYGFKNVNGASIAATTQADVTTTVTGILATDVVAGVSKPSSQGAGIVGYRVPSADTITVQFMNVSSGAVTPTTTETLTATVVRKGNKGPLKLYTATITPTSVAASSSAEQTTTVTGLIASSSVFVNKPTNTPGIVIAGVRVTAANTLGITYLNTTNAAIVPPAESYTVGNFQKVGPGAANSVSQPFTPMDGQLQQLGAALNTLNLTANS